MELIPCPNCGADTGLKINGICENCGVENNRMKTVKELFDTFVKDSFKWIKEIINIDQQCAMKWVDKIQQLTKSFAGV